MRIPLRNFWRCKIDEISTILVFTLGSLYDTTYLVFSSKVRNFLNKCLRITASPLCSKSFERGTVLQHFVRKSYEIIFGRKG